MKLKNISICKLGEEECKVCLEHSHHQYRKIDEEEATENDGSDHPSISIEEIDSVPANKDTTEEEKEPEQSYSTSASLEKKLKNIIHGVCDICDNWVSHMKMAKESRDAYRTDADT